MNRALLSITCAFMAGIIIDHTLRWSVTIWLALAGAAFLVMAFFYVDIGRIPAGKKKKAKVVSLFLCAILLGACWYSLSRISENIYPDLPGKYVTGEGTIVTYPRPGEYNATCTVALQKLEYRGQLLPGLDKVLLKIKNPAAGKGAAFLPGNKISFNGLISLPSGARNPGEFNYREYLANMGVFHMVQCDQKEVRLIEQGRGFRIAAAKGRVRISEYLAKIMPLKERGLLLGILFGDVTGITPADWEGYQRAGVLHLFAVSGFNVAFVLGIVWFLLSFFQPKPVWKLAVGIPVLLGYYFLVGWTASIVRATLMAVLSMLAVLADRKKDIYTALSLAALIILLISPGELFQVSFQLSFIATFGIVYLTPYLNRRGLGKILAPTLAAQLATWPLVIYYFNQFSLIAPFMNILAVGACGIVTVIALLGCMLVWLVPLLASPLLLTAGFIMYLVSECVLFAAGLEWANLLLPTPPIPVIVLVYGVLLALPYLPRYSWLLRRLPGIVKTGCVTVVFLALFWQAFLHQGKMAVTFLDVGQGDSIFIQTPGGNTVLIDGGGSPGSDYAVGEKVIKPFLDRRGIRKIDLMVMSHNHTDHSEGLIELIPLVRVGAFVMPPAEENNENEQKIRQLCQKFKIPLRELTAGQSLKLDQHVVMEVLHPPPDDLESGNNHSLVLRVSYQKTSWLLTGDIENPALENLLNTKKDLSADFLKLPHHGSVSSFNPDFYQAVSPQAVVISVGVNFFNQPHPQVEDYFTAREIPLYNTREQGAVITESDGKNISLP